jgi:predicted Zn-ribbon and HTH transcriptional regulator
MRFTPINYTCPGCGAPLKYSPLTGTLRCEFCRREVPIEGENAPIVEHDLRSALATLDHAPNQEITKEITCPKCGSGFTLDPLAVSTNCPYCGTPTITEFVNEIHPESILPFRIRQKEARAIFARWIGSLWLAPNELKHLVDTEKSLEGYYIPYWTYDAQTTTDYTGQRGDIYYVTVQKRMMVNGREQIVSVQEPRIQWTPVSGRVNRFFDDVIIRASKSPSRQILDALEPWDTTELVPFDPRYLSGFESEEYAVGLDNGFEMARVKIDRVIRDDIRRDIGGDEQQIDRMQTHYGAVTYKNTLFPIWMTHFTYKGREYYYAINGQNGKIVGERPYSYTKIIFLILAILGLLAGATYFDAIRTYVAPRYDRTTAPHTTPQRTPGDYFQRIATCEANGGVWNYVNEYCERTAP